IPLILGIWGGKGQGKSFQYFFGSLRARVYDDEVTKWIGEVGVESIGKNLINSREGPPTFQKHAMTVEKLLEYGNMLVKEQENVKRVQLADKYMAEADLGEANEDAIKIGAFYGKAAQQVNLPIPEGCIDPSAENYDPTTRNDDGTCFRCGKLTGYDGNVVLADNKDLCLWKLNEDVKDRGYSWLKLQEFLRILYEDLALKQGSIVNDLSMPRNP
ncbi:hypothetical protein KI387_014273, partial [Taxus chinensis]